MKFLLGSNMKTVIEWVGKINIWWGLGYTIWWGEPFLMRGE